MIILLSLSACSDSHKLPTLNDRRLISTTQRCKDLFTAEINAWNARDPEALRKIYTDDIAPVDGAPLFMGLDAVVEMAREMMTGQDVSEAGTVYISKEECLGTWKVWGIYGFTRQNPGTQYDFLQFHGGKISYWRRFYDQAFFNSGIGKSEDINTQLLTHFAITWSTGNIADMLFLYTPQATLEDSLYGYSVSGQQAIAGYMTKFLAKNPGAAWKLMYPFAERQSPRQLANQTLASQGGLFSITVKGPKDKPCDIYVAVILTPDENGAIVSQKVFYNALSLIGCGWAK